jgi:hypothetical protein
MSNVCPPTLDFTHLPPDSSRVFGTYEVMYTFSVVEGGDYAPRHGVFGGPLDIAPDVTASLRVGGSFFLVGPHF